MSSRGSVVSTEVGSLIASDPAVIWDAIVIGSGAGGLTAAVALARAGQRVLVLEQHYLPGGWMHSFTLDGYSFSPGVHYVGEIGEGGALRRVFEGLGLGQSLSFWQLNPDGYDHLLIDGERFDVPSGHERRLERMICRFPELGTQLRDYFSRSRAIARDLQRCDELLSFPRVLALPWLAPSLTRWGFSTTGRLLDRSGIDDTLARALLSARCGNHGLAPSEVSAPVHAAMTEHYENGAYYPRGGARRITAAYVKELRRNGGSLELRTRVRRILVEAGRAVGVELEDGQRILGRRVVSNADAVTTYASLLPETHALRQRRRAQRLQPSVSCLSLFAAVDLDLRARGYDSGNYWWYRDRRVDHHYRRAALRLPNRSIDALFVSVSSLKDPTARHDGRHTLEMFTFVPHAPFARWRDTDGDRPAAYRALKARLTRQMLAAAEQVIPGLTDALTFCELGTPLTNDFYCASRQGACYGTAKTPWQVGPFAISTRAPVKNLHLCGASTLSHGVAGAVLSGLMVARDILEVDRIDECLSRADGSLKTELADGYGGARRGALAEPVHTRMT